MQKISNYDDEIHRITGELTQITQTGLTIARIEKRIETLKMHKKEIL